MARGKQAASRHTEPDLLYLDLRSSEWSTDIREPEQGRDPDHEVEFRSGLVKLNDLNRVTHHQTSRLVSVMSYLTEGV